jgi:transposase
MMAGPPISAWFTRGAVGEIAKTETLLEMKRPKLDAHGDRLTCPRPWLVGLLKRTRLFVLTLGYSRKSVRVLTWKSSAQIWAELHERAFRRLGGSTKVVVLDNLLEGVLTPDVYDATLNPLYRDVLPHYGVVAMPCRVRDPNRKGKVESGVGHAQKTPLRGQRFEHIDAA